MSLRTVCLPGSARGRARFVYQNPHQLEVDKVRGRQETKAFILDDTAEMGDRRVIR